MALLGSNEQLQTLKDIYYDIYGSYGGDQASFDALLSVMEAYLKKRSKSLRKKDQEDHNWFMNENMVGMMLYVDLFAGDFKGLVDKIPYLNELGITYVHLMPLLKPRVGENDGGYAVEDYKDVDPKLGTLDDFKAVLKAFRKAGIAVCIDYVFNHTSDTHEWAKKALEGHVKYQNMYEMYDTREVPDRYDPFIPEVLPDKHPGNFTWKPEIEKWVFTSFSDFQWDLNFKNPYVFEQMIDIMLYLANLGVNILRMDAIAFIWKEPGTSCRNLDGAHKIMKALNIIKEMVCPSLELLGEAIVEPDEIIKYFGTEDQVECGLLYNANFMVNIYNAMATRDVRLLARDNRHYVVPTTGCFMNYVRCHDDIGWGFNEDYISQLGFDPYWHKQFLIKFYGNDFEGTFSSGEKYQYNPRTQDARINGTLASLMGLEKAEQSNNRFDYFYAMNRIKLVTTLLFTHQGIPLLYSGDELATLNDQSYKKDPDKAPEGRWVHRPIFDWERANKRSDKASDVGEIFGFTKRLIDLRKNEPLLNGRVPIEILYTGNDQVYSFTREMADEGLLCIYNFSEHEQLVDTINFRKQGYTGILKDRMDGRLVDMMTKQIKCYPYETLWLKK